MPTETFPLKMTSLILRAFCRAFTVAVVDFYVSEIPLDKEQDSSSFTLPVFLKQPVAIHHNPPVM